MAEPGAREILTAGIANRVFPAAAAEVGDRDRVLWRDALGTLTFAPDAAPAGAETVFDLASLTKPVVTATLAMQLAATGKLDLREPVSAFFPEWRGADREAATVRDLLEHASGLAARLVDPPPESRREFEHDISVMKLQYAARSRSVYSDLGFILLGFLIADRGRAPLDLQFETVLARTTSRKPPEPDRGTEVLQFDLSAAQRERTAPTMPLDEDMRRGRMLIGEVHDNYSAALGGVTGHSGLFGTAGAVGLFARTVLRGALGDQAIPVPFAPHLVTEMTRKSAVPGSSRALGWDTMLPTSSCGVRMSPAAFGHVGFTGTSVWIDPILDRYFVLLTNRVGGGGTLDQMRQVRRAFHDAAVEIE